jgi:putative flippase GtrA
MTQNSSQPHPATITSMLLQRARQHEQALKYLVIGGAASAIDVLLFMILFNFAGFTEWQSHSVSVPVSVLFSFLVNARHNFKTNDHMWLRLMSFSIVCLIGFFAGYGVIEAARAAGIDSNIGKIASLPVVFVIQFVLNSRITFRKAKAQAAPKGAT